MDFFMLIWLAHKACINLEYQAFFFSYNNFLMILIKLLFEDSANLFPYG